MIPMLTYQLYPTGFRSPIFSGSRTDPVVDREIAELFEIFTTGISPLPMVELRHRVIQATKRLFGNFSSWLDAQDQNTDISETAYDLIVNTIQYINTGRRNIALETHKAIIEQELRHQQYRNPRAEKRNAHLRDLLKVPHDEFIYHWLQHPTGFSDMLCTVYYLFGSKPE